MIRAEHLTKYFEARKILDDLCLHVPRGAVYGLIGPNGAGKTTLIRHLVGIYRPNDGCVKVGGAPIYENPVCKQTIAYVPDEIFYFEYSNVRDMMKFYAEHYPKFDMEKCRKLMEALSIDEKRAFRKLSKGMQKQVALLFAICIRPEVMILDEPIDGLDPVMRRQIWSLVMQDVAEFGTTVLVSSHNLRELEDVCDHVGILHRGKLLLERSLHELQENIVKVQAAFEGEMPQELETLHTSKLGRVETLIVRGDRQSIEQKLVAAKPIFFDMLPLSLEEVFIYELGGVDYEIKNILL